MPPRGSPSRKAKAKPTVVELSESDSDSGAPRQGARAAPPPPKKKTRASPRASLSSSTLDKDAGMVVDDDYDGDLALARQLQEEEDSRAQAQSGAGPSGSSSSSRPRLSPKKAHSSAVPVLVHNSNDPADPHTILAPHRSLFLPPEKDKKCACGAHDFATPDKPEITASEARKEFYERGALSCLTCPRKICRGCWEPTEAEPASCCAAQRVVVLFEILDALDTAYLAERLRKPAQTDSPGTAKAKPKKPRGQIKGNGAGTGYGSGVTHNHAGYGGGGYGYGYGDEYSEDEEYFEDEEEYAEYMAEMGYELADVGKAFAAHKAKHQRKAPVQQPAPVKTNAKEVAQDKVFLAVLQLVAALLPSQSGENIWDWLPHEALGAVLLVSTLPDLLADLLRNDSVSDWIGRADLYFATLNVLQKLGDSEATLGVLFGSRYEKKWSDGIGPWMRGAGEICWERRPVPSAPKGRGKKRKLDEEVDAKIGDVILAPPLFDLLKRLVTQAEAFRKAASLGSFDAGDAALLGLCGDICSAGDRCQSAKSIWSQHQQRNGIVDPVPSAPADSPTTSKGKGKGKAVELDEYSDSQYATAWRALAYDTVELGTSTGTYPTHHYHRELAASASSQRPHGGFVHLAKELAVLSTSLPTGIALRVDETRIDAIKCIIVGPEGTPYAGGVFESVFRSCRGSVAAFLISRRRFDIFIPLQYPQTPPLVWLRTTGNNAVRFNPNLYAEGKVCLSILGTWPGSPEEMWQPSASTLLQVLISIQAMILGTTMPYYNEPGYGAPKDSKPNKDYNANIHLANVRHAQLYWLETKECQTGIWGDILSLHFQFRKRSLLETAKTWAKQDGRMRRWTPAMNHLAGGTQSAQPAGQNGHLYGLPPAATGHPSVPQAKGKGKAVAAVPPPTPAPIAERDLVADLEANLEACSKWRDSDFFKALLA